MLVSRIKIEFPDDCPDGCAFEEEVFHQGGTCHRCPIFNCTSPPGENFRLIEPEDYREDWAVEWKKFFDKEIDFPRLSLEHAVEHEYEREGIQGDVPDLRK